jgi:hypothetical protein
MILLRDIVLYTIFLLIILFNLLVLFYNKNSNTCAYYRVKLLLKNPFYRLIFLQYSTLFQFSILFNPHLFKKGHHLYYGLIA